MIIDAAALCLSRNTVDFYTMTYLSCKFVMPDLIRHPVFLWIPAFAGMTICVINYAVVYKTIL